MRNFVRHSVLGLLSVGAWVSACGSTSTAEPNETDSGTEMLNDATVVPTADATKEDTGPIITNTPIKHVIVIVKENHTFDNFFGSFPGAEGTTMCKTNLGNIPCPHAPDSTSRDLCHEHECALTAWNGGAMNGWDYLGTTTKNGDNLAYSQYHETDIPNYWAYAKAFTLGDHFFANVLGPSFPGHTFVLAAQAGWAYNNPQTQITHPYWGCDQSSGTTIPIQDQTTCGTKNPFPCFKIPSVPDVLPTGVDWKFYGSNFYVLPEIWSMFNAIDSVRNQPRWDHIVKTDQFATDIAKKQLPAVTWLVNQDLNDEHPNIGGICNGENWTVDAINQVMQSDYWASTAIILTYDDWGGWYDHVPPPRQYGCDAKNPYGLGFRLPLLVISPYAKPGFIFKEVSEQASIPKFIERVFHATSTLHALDPAAQDDVANDLFGAFDFSQTPLAPLVLTKRKCN